jgi:hypothetical protein
MKYLFLIALAFIVSACPSKEKSPEEQRQIALDQFCLAHPNSVDCTGPCVGNDGSDSARFVWP